MMANSRSSVPSAFAEIGPVMEHLRSKILKSWRIEEDELVERPDGSDVALASPEFVWEGAPITES